MKSSIEEHARKKAQSLVAKSSVNSVAKTLGIPQPTLHRIVNSNRGISAKTIQKLCPDLVSDPHEQQINNS